MTKASPFSPYRVLYLEDEALIAHDTGEHLRSLGFADVTCVYRLKHAEEAARAQHYHLAIFDINVDGDQTSVALGEHLARCGTKVIFATGSSPEGERLNGLGFYHLGKPFTLHALTWQIEAALATQNA